MKKKQSKTVDSYLFTLSAEPIIFVCKNKNKKVNINKKK